jgi:5-methylcytosine-specific restriction endonuclease McrA
MAQEFAKSFYKSAAWLKCRESYIKSVHHLCERCKDGTLGFIVHHKIYITEQNINDPSITLNHDNLEYVCHDCHNKEHHGSKHEVVEDGLMFDSNGQLVKV